MDRRSPRLVKIVVLDSEVQAEALDGLLTERQIPHVMRSYSDSSLDGIFQAGHGWGHVEAPEAERASVLDALAEITRKPPESPDD